LTPSSFALHQDKATYKEQSVHSFIHNMKHAVLHYRTGEPNLSDLKNTVYGKVHEEISTDIPEPLVQHVVLSHYLDAHFFHNITFGRSVAGILHLVNQTQLIGLLKSKQHWRQQLEVQNLCLRAYKLNKLLIFALLSDI